MFYKEGVLKNFSKFTEKHLCQSLLFNKVSGVSLQLYFKKETLAQVLYCEFCEIFKKAIFTEHFWKTASASRFPAVIWNEIKFDYSMIF